MDANRKAYSSSGSICSTYMCVCVCVCVCIYIYIYTHRVIHKSLWDFRTRLRNNQDRLGRKEHINRERETLQVWRDSLPTDMLLSAMSVLVVVQSSSEIPEGLTNNPVYNDL